MAEAASSGSAKNPYSLILLVPPLFAGRIRESSEPAKCWPNLRQPKTEILAQSDAFALLYHACQEAFFNGLISYLYLPSWRTSPRW